MEEQKPSLWLREGKQSRETKAVKEVSKSFTGTAYERIAGILEWISKNLKPCEDPKKVIRIFASRTASRIIREGFHTGCHDVALVFVTLARSVGIPAKYLVGIDKLKPRSRGHCVSEVLVDNRWILVDPSGDLICLTPSRSDFFVKNYLIGEGLDSWDVGIKEFDSWKKKSNELIGKIQNIEIA